MADPAPSASLTPFTEDEQRLLAMAPTAVAVLVASVDGKIEQAELQAATAHFKAHAHPLFVAAMSAHHGRVGGPSMLQFLLSDVFRASNALGNACRALDARLAPADAAAAKDFLLGVAHATAEARTEGKPSDFAAATPDRAEERSYAAALRAVMGLG
jgi:hypothetical protein